MLLFFFMAVWCSSFRGCWDALFILEPLNLCAVSRCWGIDRVQWWTASVSPAANQKVNSLSIEEGKWPPELRSAHRSLSHAATQIQLLLTLSVCTQNASVFFVSLSDLILSPNPYICPHISSSENFLWPCLMPNLILFKENRIIICSILHFSVLYMSMYSFFSLCTFICAFLRWKLKALFVSAKLEGNPVITSLRLYVWLGD